MMEKSLVALVASLALLILVIGAALVEVFRQLDDVRSALNMRDEPIALNLKSRGKNAAELLLPREVEDIPSAIVILLSAKCATCLAVAEAFRGGSPETVWFIVPTDAPSHLLNALAQSAPRVIPDHQEKIAAALGLAVTPSVVTFAYGVVEKAQAVSTARQVMGLIPTTIPNLSRGLIEGSPATEAA